MNGMAQLNIKTCEQCGKTFRRSPKLPYARFAKRRFCSFACSVQGRRLTDIPTPWTAERDAALKEMYGVYTARQIAETLGVSRNAVIGRAYRLGFAGETPSSRARVRKTRRRARRRAASMEVPVSGIPLLDLTPTTCRWPQGHPGEPNFSFCGARCPATKPYCDFHTAKATTKQRERGEYVSRGGINMRAGAMR